jgi:heme exporter protein D
MASAFIMLMYLIKVRLFKSSLLNTTEIFDEGCLLLASYHSYLLTDYSPDPVFRYKVGWSLVVLTLVNILFNLVMMVGQTLKSLKAILKILMKKLEKLSRQQKAPNTTEKMIPVKQKYI